MVISCLAAGFSTVVTPFRLFASADSIEDNNSEEGLVSDILKLDAPSTTITKTQIIRNNKRTEILWKGMLGRLV